MNKFVKTVTRTVVETEIDWAGIADAVEVLVMEKLQRDLEDWAEDRGMRAMFLSDAGDGIWVCENLAGGVWSEVDKRLCEMDTAARDYLYDFIGQVAGEEFFKLVNK
jgi:hypothetical protein